MIEGAAGSTSPSIGRTGLPRRLLEHGLVRAPRPCESGCVCPQDHVFVSLELQNCMPNPLFLESVALDPTAHYTLADHSVHADDLANEAPMSPEEVRRFLFELVPRSRMAPTGVA